MGRREANLAGLAALGALGYKLSQGKNMAPVEDRSTLDDLRSQEDVDTGRAMRAMPTSSAKAGASDEDVSQAMDAGYMGRGKKFNTETGELYDTEAPAKARVASASSAGRAASSKPSMMSQEEAAKIRATGGSRGTRYAEKSPNQAAYEAAQVRAASPEGRAERKRMEESQAIENMTGDFLPVGKLAKTVGAAAKTARTALATRAAEETPVTFLGKSGRRAMGEAERLGQAQKRLRGPEAAEAAEETLKTLPSPKRALEYQTPEAGREAVFSKKYWTSGGAEMKKGGAVKKMASGGQVKKPAAKGWGQARGAKAAKYY